MRRHRPIGSLKYPGPHLFRLVVLLDAEADAAATADDDDCDGGGGGGGGVDDDDDCEPATTADDSLGRSDVLPLLAISASTIWTILSLLDGEYGSSSANDGDAELTVTVESVLYGGTDAVLSDGTACGGLDGASVGSV